MKILAADTSTTVITVAVCDSDRVLGETAVNADRKHSERLLDTVDWLLDECGLVLDEIDALAISNGPGSFTGLRVGVAAWKGLAFGQNKPLIAVPTLDAMTRLGIFENILVCPLIDAKMGQVFGSIYSFTSGVRSKLVPDKVCAVEDLLDGLAENLIVLGDGAIRYKKEILAIDPNVKFAAAQCNYPRASCVAFEAAALLSNGIQTSADSVSPIYLRKSQAEENRSALKSTTLISGAAADEFK